MILMIILDKYVLNDAKLYVNTNLTVQQLNVRIDNHIFLKNNKITGTLTNYRVYLSSKPIGS